ncbi:N-carbamoyl-D-amino-acid hydrolase [Ensifer adhaerens]|uniref:nitrilase-related carbon-nitrogen hydrolase n=1 Tax=Ensifer adhaerens TaxID=106592 RepID=UPI001CBCCD43|nr:nitrilase-related carbon-nitrogen hydrolase [Ensifer adhaerens]MBZ7924955.1 N-carbamoyl-D-amino-acid hydrolase [Ensifer adhaerens]UAX95835.1 N-carbamoyl-D-amino-acid hydrolase [Ensifer adhaerens]UAY04823.1 N-carbamoyl-D-amino-acid hydrolase [Ensifer adhaerens]UAY10255.1 N-carbamoyl-D-amino-acid hydrolase [Ensifer adhaerens]
MTRYLTLAACQLGPTSRTASRRDTVDRLIYLLERAATGGADLAVFPELALTPFFPRWDIEEGAELLSFYEASMPGPETTRLYQAAAKLKIGFSIGYAELVRDGDRIRRYNTADLVGRDGRCIGRYRKIHLPGGDEPTPATTVTLERRYFEPGDLGFGVFDFAGVRVGMAICNDRRWPETYRMLCLNGAEVVLIGYNTPSSLDEAPEMDHLREFHSHLSMQAGAYGNTLWIAAAAKAGMEEGQMQIGGSCIIAPTGEIATKATSIEDEVVLYRSNLDLIATCRKVNFNFANYRRPDQYRLIAERAGPI